MLDKIRERNNEFGEFKLDLLMDVLKNKGYSDLVVSHEMGLKACNDRIILLKLLEEARSIIHTANTISTSNPNVGNILDEVKEQCFKPFLELLNKEEINDEDIQTYAEGQDGRN